MNIEDKIENYLKGEIPPEEQLAFEKAMQTDSGLREKVELEKEIIEQIKARAFVDSQIKNAKDKENAPKPMAYHSTSSKPIIHHSPGYSEPNIDNKNRKQKKPIRIYSIIAAAVLIGIIITINVQQNFNLKKIYNQQFTIYENDLVSTESFRGGQASEPYDLLISNGFKAYELKDYNRAMSSFNSALDIQDKPEIRFYLALAQLSLQKTQKAKINLIQLLEEPKDFCYYEETRWYLALAYLKQGKKQKAKKLLDELIKLEGYYYDKAVELKGDL